MEIRAISKISIRNPKQYFFQQACVVSGLSIFAILNGIIPSISSTTQPINFDNHAYAQTQTLTTQTFSLETIWRYAAAVQEINPIREEHNQEVNLLLRDDRPTRVCYQTSVPWAVKQSCESFGSKMIGILKKYQVHDAYTPISIQVKSDENLKKKIQKAGVCQQKGISLNDCF